ncbi:MAG: AMP-binding protein, partial [Burkholderiales bacterium]|nr:AMP-binding protein [Burkholderiales bacterium]
MHQQLQTLSASFAQTRLWFLVQLDHRASAAYNLSYAHRIRGTLDEAAFRCALDRIVARHEVLRTCLVETRGRPRQLIREPTPFALRTTDLSALSDPIGEATRLGNEEARQPFDLSQGPLVRGQLLKLADQDHVFLLTMHHVVSDAWSMDIFEQEFRVLYAASLAGQGDPLPPLSLQYADYAIWQRKTLDEQALQALSEFWRRSLADAPSRLNLPFDHARSGAPDFAGDSVAFTIAPALGQALRALGRRHGTTLFMTLLAAWATLLARISGQATVVIGTASAGRTLPEVENLIGFFANTLALRIDVTSGTSVNTLLERVRRVTLEAQDHQELPFEQVIDAVKPIRSLEHHPLFQVMFSLRSAGSGQSDDAAMSGLSLTPFATTTANKATFDLALSLQESETEFVGNLSFATDLFEHASIERHAAQFVTLLQAMVEDDSACVLRLPLLPETEQTQLLAFNATETGFDAELCIHQLFEQQARLRPEATALVFEQEQLSYAALNARANQLAHHLVALGVGPDTRVALALPRSAELVLAELAVLKCGAAYVPMDLEHPNERLAFIAADCGARLLLCREDFRLAGVDIPHVAIQRLDLRGAQATCPPVATHPLQAAYVMYTSGSTGQPKGVVVPHQAVAHFALNRAHVTLQPSDRVAFLANVAFDASTFEVWATLLNGASSVV